MQHPELIAPPERAAQLRGESSGWPSIDLTPPELCDLELLLNGAFAPLQGFMTRAEYESVTRHARLPDDTVWPTPVTLAVDRGSPHQFSGGDRIALRDREGVMLAALTVDGVWSDDTGRRHIGGHIEGLQLPVHHDFKRFRMTAAQVRLKLSASEWLQTACFQALSPAAATVLAPVFDQARASDL